MRKVLLGLVATGLLLSIPSAAHACRGPFNVGGTLTLEDDDSYTCQASGPITCPSGYQRTKTTATFYPASMTCDIEWYCCKNPLPVPLSRSDYGISLNSLGLGAATVVIGDSCIPMSEPQLPIVLELPLNSESAAEDPVESAA